MSEPHDVTRRVPVRVHEARGVTNAEADVSLEAPLQVRVNGAPFAVIMRTPGADVALAAGFLLAEGIVTAPSDLAAVTAFPDDPALGNIVNVVLSDEAARASAARLEDRRRVVANASCGLCGRVRVESLLHDAPPLAVEWQMDPSVVHGLPARLRARQESFTLTGGVHAAALFSRDGRIAAVEEDVGRHNAVDKLTGRALMDGRLPLGDAGLLVSGRASFEIVQKAFLAGIPVVVAISAPSSLAVRYADASGLTLVAFAREGRFSIFSHPSRID